MGVFPEFMAPVGRPLAAAGAVVALIAAAAPAQPEGTDAPDGGLAEVCAYTYSSTMGRGTSGEVLIVSVPERRSTEGWTRADHLPVSAEGAVDVLTMSLITDHAAGYPGPRTATTVTARALDRSPLLISQSESGGPASSHRETRFLAGRVEFRSLGHGETPVDASLEPRVPAFTEDHLLLWLRGPAAAAWTGQEWIHLLPREWYGEPLWLEATLARRPETEEIDVPAGRFRVRVFELHVPDQPYRTYHIEDAPPHRLVRCEYEFIERMELTGSVRVPAEALPALDAAQRAALGLGAL